MLDLFLAAILITGLIKPSIFKRVTKTIPKRKTVVLIGLGVMFVSYIGTSLFASDVEERKDNSIFINYTKQHGISKTIKTTTTENVVTSTSQSVKAKTAQSIKTESASVIQTNSQYEYYSVSSIVDGDTIKVNMNGMVVTLRLIGMDTPETVDPRKLVQCFGKEASNKAKGLLIGKKVRIEKDFTQGELDKYGRTLAYIYREDGLFYNKYMIEQGYAHEYTYNSNPYKYQTEFKAAQKSAQENQRGLWSPDTCNGDTALSAPTSASSQTTTTNSSTSKYHTSSFLNI